MADVMETEETRSQGNLDPTLKRAEQLKAAATARSDEAKEPVYLSDRLCMTCSV